MIDKLSSDLLLAVFKNLDSQQMVKVVRVKKEWLEIIEENSSMWRKLILPKRDLGWGLQALRVFDEKSGSKLTEISIDLSLKRSEKVDELVEIVERSRETLKSLEFGISSSR